MFQLKRVLVLCLMFGCSMISAQTVVPVKITNSETWTKAGSPYLIQSNVEIRQGADVKVEPGVEVQFVGNTVLMVNGSFRADGTSSEPVKISNASISFEGNKGKYSPHTKEGNQLNHCIMSGKGMTNPFAMVQLKANNLGISYSHFSNSKMFFRGNRDSSKVFMYYSKIVGTEKDRSYSFQNFNFGSEKGSVLIMHNCSLMMVTDHDIPYISEIKHCVFRGNKYHTSGASTGIHFNYCHTSEFMCNEVSNFDMGLEVFGYIGNGILWIYNNNIDSCNYLMRFNCFNTEFNRMLIEYNNLLTYYKYAIYTAPCGGTPAPIDAEFWANWWGTTDKNLIDSGIYDYNDDVATKFKIDYRFNLTEKQNLCCVPPEPLLADVGPLTGCAPLEVGIDFNKEIDRKLEFYINDSLQSIPHDSMMKIEDGGIYKLKFVFTDTAHCGGVDSTIFKIEAGKKPIAKFNALAKGCDGKVEVENLSEFYRDILWTLPDGSNSQELKPEFYVEPGVQSSLKLILDWDSLCSDTLEQTIEFKVEPSLDNLQMYNVFTPGSDDQYNEGFGVSGADQQCYEYRIQIYNRWGLLIYESEDSNGFWDGKNKQGKECSAGTYYCLYMFKDRFSGEVTEYSGTVQLIR